MPVKTNLNWYPEKFVEETNGTIINKLDTLGSLVVGEAKDTCPVKTGKLKESIRKELDENEKVVYVGSDVHYSVHVELGTERQAANPFLRRALAKVQQLWDSIV